MGRPVIDPAKLQVLLEVAGRAPMSLAEKLVISELAETLLQLAAPPDADASPDNAPPPDG